MLKKRYLWGHLLPLLLATAGCWEVTGTYGDHTLWFVVLVEP